MIRLNRSLLSKSMCGRLPYRERVRRHQYLEQLRKRDVNAEVRKLTAKRKPWNGAAVRYLKDGSAQLVLGAASAVVYSGKRIAENLVERGYEWLREF